MSVQPLFFSVDAIAVFAMLLFGFNVLLSAPQRRNARLLALIALSSGCAVLLGRQDLAYWIPDAYRIDVGVLRLPFHIARNLTPGLLMILCFSLFQDKGTFPRWLLGAFALQIVLEVLGAMTLADGVAQFAWLRSVPAFLELVFIGFALYWLLDGWRSDLVEARRRLRWIILVVIGTFVFVVVLLERLVIPWSTSVATLYSHTATSIFDIAVVVVALIASRSNQLSLIDPFVEEKKDEPATPAQADPHDAGVERILKAFRDERIYRDGELTVASLATKLSMPEYRLRRLIHERMGYRNFNVLLHEYRIAEACRDLSDPTKDHLPILTIALTVGYNSINPFNRAFREAKGMTPSAFRAQAQHKDDIAENKA